MRAYCEFLYSGMQILKLCQESISIDVSQRHYSVTRLLIYSIISSVFTYT